MQSVPVGFTAEERDDVRAIAHNLLVSWKKDTNLSAVTFTIGISLIGGDDLIGINRGAIGSPSNYLYFDESDYVMSMSWERGLNMPTGGLVKAMSEVILDNTDGRFLPHYIGGNSELFTAILPRRPFIMNAGFRYNGIDQVLPQMTGITSKPPEIDIRSRRVKLQGYDYVNYFQNRFLDETTMFTSLRSDVVIESLLSQLGMSTAQYDLDDGINIIPFGMFEKGTKFSDAIGQIVEAENGHFYQDEEGVFRFENRQHWDSAPHNVVSRILYTSEVLEVNSPSYDHIINTVEIKSKGWKKQPSQVIFQLNKFDYLTIAPDTKTEIFIDFENPILEMDTPSVNGTTSYFMVNTMSDGSGLSANASVALTSVSQFAQSAKLIFTSTSVSELYITGLVITGRPVKVERDIYVRSIDGSSRTVYEERLFQLENKYIQNSDWAESYAQMILGDYSEPENVIEVKISAQPSIQLGDLISYQGRYWRVINIRSTLSKDGGFVQELTLLHKTINSYFRIGISAIGEHDKIAP